MTAVGAGDRITRIGGERHSGGVQASFDNSSADLSAFSTAQSDASFDAPVPDQALNNSRDHGDKALSSPPSGKRNENVDQLLDFLGVFMCVRESGCASQTIF